MSDWEYNLNRCIFCDKYGYKPISREVIQEYKDETYTVNTEVNECIHCKEFSLSDEQATKLIKLIQEKRNERTAK